MAKKISSKKSSLKKESNKKSTKIKDKLSFQTALEQVTHYRTSYPNDTQMIIYPVDAFRDYIDKFNDIASRQTLRSGYVLDVSFHFMIDSSTGKTNFCVAPIWVKRDAKSKIIDVIDCFPSTPSNDYDYSTHDGGQPNETGSVYDNGDMFP